VFNATFKPQLLCRWPEKDYDDCPLSENVAMFCFPSNVRLLVKSKADEGALETGAPILYSFVLTQLDGSKQYGVCLKYFELQNDKQLSGLFTEVRKARGAAQLKDQPDKEKGKRKQELTPDELAVIANKTHNTQCPKVMCILSQWPFFSFFSTLLKTFYRVTLLMQEQKFKYL